MPIKYTSHTRTLAAMTAIALLSGTASLLAQDASTSQAADSGDSMSAEDKPMTNGHGTSPHGSNPPVELPAGVLAMVNGRTIGQEAVDNVMRQVAANGQSAEPDRVLAELINLELLTQAAEKDKLDEEADVAAALQLQYTQTMANAYLARLNDNIEIGEEQLKAEYERQIAGLGAEEYRASHILLETESDARSALEKLDAGADFAALAMEISLDPAGENGGDLGWFSPGTMVPEFQAAVEKLSVEEVTADPVESQFGWHIIKLNEVREAAAPAFEEVRENLRGILVRNEMARIIDDLRLAADIRQ